MNEPKYKFLSISFYLLLFLFDLLCLVGLFLILRKDTEFLKIIVYSTRSRYDYEDEIYHLIFDSNKETSVSLIFVVGVLILINSVFQIVNFSVMSSNESIQFNTVVRYIQNAFGFSVFVLLTSILVGTRNLVLLAIIWLTQFIIESVGFIHEKAVINATAGQINLYYLSITFQVFLWGALVYSSYNVISASGVSNFPTICWISLIGLACIASLRSYATFVYLRSLAEIRALNQGEPENRKIDLIEPSMDTQEGEPMYWNPPQPIRSRKVQPSVFGSEKKPLIAKPRDQDLNFMVFDLFVRFEIFHTLSDALIVALSMGIVAYAWIKELKIS